MRRSRTHPPTHLAVQVAEDEVHVVQVQHAAEHAHDHLRLDVPLVCRQGQAEGGREREEGKDRTGCGERVRAVLRRVRVRARARVMVPAKESSSEMSLLTVK